MQKTKFFLLTALVALVCSCGKSGQELTPESTDVEGALGDCFNIVERTYKPVGENQQIVTIELERTYSSLPFQVEDGTEINSFNTTSSAKNVQVGFGIEFLDDEGNILDKVNAEASGLSASYSPDEAVALVKLESGKTGSIRFVVNDEAKKATKFRITSAYKENGTSVLPEEDIMSDSIISSDIVTSGSSDWDALLDSYEDYVGQYIAMMRKAANGDMSAMSEYPALMEKAQEYGEKLSNAQGTMSASQWSRYMRIHENMLKAAQNM